jgi:pimeloyl-ACP methyl ester carboxylesterase
MPRYRQLFALALLLPGLAAHAQRPRDRMQERIATRRPNQGASIGTPHTLGGRTVTVWLPATRSAAPLVLFSHGIGGCETQSTFLTSALAQAGYAVVGIRHRDAKCGTGGRTSPDEPFGAADQWTDATYRDRRDDLVAVLTALRTDSALASRVDVAQLALVGHSLGGYTVLGTSGAWPTWMMQGVRAIVALSPYCEPFVDRGALGKLSAPVQFQGGTRDLGITPSVRRPGGCYDRAASPAMYVEFRDAGHFAWTDQRTSAHAAIIATTRGFLDEQVRRRPATPLPASLAAAVSDTRRK